jgi:hypothetical protein
MHEKHIQGGRKASHEAETITSITIQSDRPPSPVGNDSCANTEIDHDIDEPAILFRPRLHFVTE